MFERFTREARDLVIGAQQHCRENHDHRITARHLLLAAASIDGPLSATLAAFGVTPERLRQAPPPPREPDAGLDPDDIEALRAMGIDLDAIRQAAEERFGSGALHRPTSRPRRWFDRLPRRTRSQTAHLPFSAGAKQALELSLREALRVNSREIRAEHIVLGALGAQDTDLRLTDIDTAGLRAAVENGGSKAA